MQANSVETMTKTSGYVKQNAEALNKIEARFQNGFRSELKDHFSKLIEEARKEARDDREKMSKYLESVNKNLEKLNETLRSPRFWVYIIGSTVAAVAVITMAVTKFMT